MTSPGGSSGITAPSDSVSSTGASSLETNTQTNVVNRKKSEVQSSPGWNGASNTLFGLLFGGFIQGITGFISFLVYALKGVTGGLIDLTGLLSDTQNTANEAAETAANASNLASVYNFDVAENTAKYPAVAPFSYPVAGYAFSGSNVALLQPATGYPAFATNRLGLDFRVTPEEKIYMEWRQRRSGANFQARLNLVVRDASGVSIAEMSPAQPLVTATDNTWAKYSGTVTIPTGAYEATPELKLQLDAGGSPAGSWAFDNVIIRRATEADLSAIQAELAGKANYSDIPTNVPLWHSINPNDDSVFPYFSLLYHTNATTNSSGTTTTSESKNPTFPTSSGEMDIGYIRAVRDRSYTQVGFMSANGGLIGAGPFEAWLHVYKMNPSTGELSLLWNSGNVAALIKSVGNGKMIRFAMTQIDANQGDVFAVGIVQRANAFNPSYNLYGAKQPFTDQPAGVHPRGLASRVNVGTTFPSASTISSASQVWDDEHTPWFFLG